jgi:hypothetical protein
MRHLLSTWSIRSIEHLLASARLLASHQGNGCPSIRKRQHRLQ